MPTLEVAVHAEESVQEPATGFVAEVRDPDKA